MRVIVNVTLKSGVLDPAGKATKHALNSLGFDSVNEVKIGKRIVLDIDEKKRKRAKKVAKKMCEELLANTVIENYKIKVKE